MKIEDLTPEQVEEFRACKTYEELMAHASEVGLELEDDRAEMLRLSFEDPDAFAERMEQVIEAVKIGKSLPERSVLLTFDDGYIDNYTYY